MGISYETLRAWQHLANAGLIEGTYSGVYVGGNYDTTNTPRSKMPRGGWFIYTFGAMGDNETFSGTWGNTISVSAIAAPYVVFTPSEAWNIDTKLDDGKPGTGTIQGYKGTAAYPCSSVANTATNPAADAAATYNLANSSTVCFLDFVRSY